MIRFFIVSLFLLLVCTRVAPAQVNVRLVTDEAEAELSILTKKQANEAITESDWQRVFQSEGYVRLQKREHSMQRSFEDADFKSFVLSDQKQVEKFLLDVLEGKLNEEQTQKTGFSFFGTQGPWYTVGWKMSVVIEKTYGRARLIECLCDQRKLLSTYNQAAASYNRRSREPLALWSNSIISRLSKVENG